MAKFKNYEESTEALNAAKEERAVAVDEYKKFCKENKIGKDEPPTDPKLLKTYTKLVDMKKKKKSAVEEIEEWRKENKPKKEPKPRVTKYDYPADCTTTADKKKFRAAQRAAAKKKAKGESGEKKEKKDKKESKESKGDKKAKKEGGEKKEKKDKSEKTED